MAEETILVKVVLEAGEYKAEIEKISQVSGTAEKAVSGLEESTKGLGAQLQKGVGLSEFKKGADEVTASLSRQKGVVEQIENDIKQLNKQLSNTAPGKAQQTLQKEVNAANRVLREEIAILKGIQSETEKTGAKKVSLTSKVRQLRNELVALELAGKRDTEQFRQLSREAGILQDAITDVSQQTKNLASDTANLDAFAQGITGLAGGFAAAQGAAALFGKENEDVQKALLKVQATLAIVNGLQAVFNTLQKQSAFSLKANAAATTIATGAMRLFGVAVNTTSTAFKVLKGAIIATGIGAIVAIIGTIASSLSSVSEKADEAKISIKDLTDQLADLEKTTRELRSKALEATLDLLVAEGKLNKSKAEEIILTQGLQKAVADAGKEALEAKGKENEATREAIKSKLAELNVLQQLRAEVLKNNNIVIEESEKEKKLRLEIEKIVADSNKRITKIEQEEAAQKELLTLISQKKIETAKVEEAKKGNKKVNKETKSFLAELEKIFLDSFNSRLDEEDRLTNENNAKRIEVVEAFNKLTKAEQKQSQESFNEVLLNLEIDLQAKIKAVRDAADEKQRAEAKALREKLSRDAILDIDTAASERIRLNKQTLQTELTDVDLVLKEQLAIFEGTEAEKRALVEDAEFAKFQIRKKYADLEQALNEQIFQAFVGTTNALFQLQQSLNARAFDDLQKQREAELANFEGTEEQKARIEEKFAAKEKQLRIQAAQQERDAAIFNAVINTAVAITAALKSANPALVALAAITGALQIAAIKSAPLPRFEKGGKVEGKSHRLGGTIIEAERDEFVVNKKAVRKHEPFIEAINKADGSFERMVFDKFVFPKIADLSPSQATILKATFKSDKIEKELRMSRKADQKNTRLLAGIMQSERHHSQSDRYRW